MSHDPRRSPVTRWAAAVTAGLAVAAIAAVAGGYVLAEPAEPAEWWANVLVSVGTNLLVAVMTFVVVGLLFERILGRAERRDDRRQRARESVNAIRTQPESVATLIEELRMSGIMYDGSLRALSFQGAVLAGADFDGADLRDCNFSLADLSEASFFGARLDGCRFDNANLKDANLDTESAVDVDFSKANL